MFAENGEGVEDCKIFHNTKPSKSPVPEISFIWYSESSNEQFSLKIKKTKPADPFLIFEFNIFRSVMH